MFSPARSPLGAFYRSPLGVLGRPLGINLDLDWEVRPFFDQSRGVYTSLVNVDLTQNGNPLVFEGEQITIQSFVNGSATSDLIDVPAQKNESVPVDFDVGSDFGGQLGRVVATFRDLSDEISDTLPVQPDPDPEPISLRNVTIAATFEEEGGEIFRALYQSNSSGFSYTITKGVPNIFNQEVSGSLGGIEGSDTASFAVSGLFDRGFFELPQPPEQSPSGSALVVDNDETGDAQIRVQAPPFTLQRPRFYGLDLQRQVLAGLSEPFLELIGAGSSFLSFRYAIPSDWSGPLTLSETASFQTNPDLSAEATVEAGRWLFFASGTLRRTLTVTLQFD